MTTNLTSFTAGPSGRERSYSRRPRGAERNVLDTARDAFTALTIGPRPLALDCRPIDGLPNRTIPLDRLRGLLLAPSCPQSARDAVWAGLVTRARTGNDTSAWMVGAVGVALPALTSITATLTARFADDPADIAAETLTGFLTALSRVDVTRPRIMLRLRWAAYRAGHAALRGALDAPPPVCGGFGSLAPAAPWGHPDLVLARAVAEGAVTAKEADLIGSTRLEEVAVADWAQAHEVSTWAVYKARQRAEQRLLTYLLDDDTAPGSRRSVRRQELRGAGGSVSKTVTPIGVQGCRQSSPTPTCSGGSAMRLTNNPRRLQRDVTRPRHRRFRLVRAWVVWVAAVTVLLLWVTPVPAAADTVRVVAIAGSVDAVLTNIRNWLMGILAGLATVFLTIGGVRYVMAAGDPGEVQKAKIAFRSAAIGYALAALAPLVVTVLQGIVGG